MRKREREKGERGQGETLCVLCRGVDLEDDCRGTKRG